MIARIRRALLRLSRPEIALLVVATVMLIGLRVAADRRGQAVRFDSYSTYDAAGGGYRAFYELLGREGVRVERFEQRPAFLGRALDTLVWVEPLPFDPTQNLMAAADVAALQTWVRAGGHLLYIGSDDVAAKDGILHLPATRSRDRRAHARHVDAALRAAGVTSVGSVAARRWRVVKRGSRVLLDDGRGPLVVRYAFGRGSVVAVIDETLLRNAGIAAYDRARLGVALAAATRSGGTLAFDEAVHGHAIPLHWWSVVPRSFAIALALAIIALLIAFAGAAVRLGPPLPPRPRDDRSTADFIDALASLLQRGDAVRSALSDALTSTSRVVARALGLPDGLSNEEIAVRIEADGARAAYRELVAVATNGFPNDANLVRGAALAQLLRKEFSAHGRD